MDKSINYLARLQTATERNLARPILLAIEPVFTEPVQRARASQLLELIDGLSLVSRRSRLDPPSDLVNNTVLFARPAADRVDETCPRQYPRADNFEKISLMLSMTTSPIP
jgi:hypothetical protein